MGFFEWTDIIATSAVITTVVQFLSGTVICKDYVDKKSTGDTSGLPFICGFLSCILWLKYGSLKSEDSVVLVNSIGALLFFSYTVVFYVFTVNKTIILRQFATVVIFIISVVSYCNYENNIENASYTVGIICCFVTIVFIAAPCTLLLQVIRTRNTESLPFPLILTSFFVSMLWLIYGILIVDSFLQITNSLGCVLSASQLSLFIIYPSKNRVVTGPIYKPLDQIGINY